MKLPIHIYFLFALLMMLSGCSSIGYPNFAVADMKLKASEQAALKIEDGLYVTKMDDDAKKPWLMKGFPEISLPDLYVIPPGEHAFEVHLSLVGRSGAASSSSMYIHKTFLPGHYYVLKYTPDVQNETVSISIIDNTDTEWWIENRNEFWAHYEKMRSDPNNPFVKVSRER